MKISSRKFYYLLLVGDGVRKNELVKLVNENNLGNRVHFLGVRNDVNSILKSVDYVVVSSHWEGFGLAAVEGMAAQKPVLASNVKGLGEVVNGAGILFEKGNEQSLAENILTLHSNPLRYSEIANKC
ncbi:glycosyltransferase family 4 protein [Sphingobacterium sp. T2]|uniref:glycosyltransferase family 4 protein n=1 Tax=Sphingobacterium sp. T2 TaxID=1590596 RepID=UPI0009E4A8FE|nr:glycosyltransferase family 4 protein [Sphingobacterium sp. T2]